MPQRSRLQMRAPQQVPAGSDWFRIENKKDDATTAEIYIFDEIGYFGTNASDFVRQLTALDVTQIDLHINSPGGDVFDGVAIYNALKAHKADVTVYVDSLAASAASFIAQAGDKVIMLRNSTMMIHDASGGAYGPSETMHQMGDLLDKVSNNIADIYSQSNDTTAEEWRLLMKEEVWYSAQEAVDAGLAHEVLDNADATAEKAAKNWDLSVFNFKGRDEAPPPGRVREQIKLSIRNRVKETLVTQPDPAGTGSPTPAADPAPAGAPAEGAPAPGIPDPAPAPEPEPAPAPAPAPAPVPANALPAGTFLVNGVQLTDPSRVQAHIASLESFRDNAVEAGKKAFVASLANDKKIIASQIPQLETFALGLTDEAYDSWKATWDLAPANPLLASHASGVSNSGGGGTNEALEQEIKDCEEIIATLRRSNMTQEQIEKTSTWAKLQSLKPTS